MNEIDADDGVVGEQVPVLLHGLGEHHDLDGALQVLEDEDGHEVALLGPLALEVGDEAADDPQQARRRLLLQMPTVETP